MGKKRKKIQDYELKGFKYFKAVSRMLESLHDAGCARDKANNRKLHMDQYASLLLLYMFNPICTSLRSLQQVSELKKVQKFFGAARASLGSLSEAATVFDSELLKNIIQELSAKLGNVSSIPGFSSNSKDILTAVDGSLIEAVGKMAWALWRSDRNGIKVHCQYEILKGTPVGMEITDANTSEKAVLASILQPNRIYVLDRGYARYCLLEKIVNTKSSFVCRIRDNAIYKTIEDKELTDKAFEEGIVFDKTVNLGGETAEMKLKNVRIVAIKCNPKTKRHHTARGGPEQSQTLLIATDRFDLEPETIAAIYNYRWTIEIYFRFFKHVLGCRHLISHNKNGIEIQMYMAIIACMLINLWTGKKVTLRTYEMVCWYFSGMADLEELEGHIARQQLRK